jgi:hypothetical protein
MDGTHDCIPSQVTGQHFFVAFLLLDHFQGSLLDPQDNAFLLKDLARFFPRKSGKNFSQNVPKKRQALVKNTDGYLWDHSPILADPLAWLESEPNRGLTKDDSFYAELMEDGT